MKVIDEAVLGSPSLTVLMVCVWTNCVRAQELCEGRGGRPVFPVPNSPYGLCGQNVSELTSCVKIIDEAVVCSPSLIVLIVSVDKMCQSSGAV